ncbi:MAG: SPOR domain-containing protein [Rhodocyclaceae bacterium]|nr:SPOR domain-containing protein [Rhodocyclaceae bacterium]
MKTSGQRGGTLLGLLLGLMAGVLLSFAVVWYLNKTPLPFVEKVAKPEIKPAGDKPLPLPGKPGDKPIEPPAEKKFEFYEILEGKKAASPPGAASASSVDPPPAAPTAPPASAAPAESGQLFLQAGAFQKAADAEQLKARLAMLGFEASIAAAEVPEKGLMHRVRVGPFSSQAELNRARAALSQNGIPATLVRIKD